MFKNTYKFKNDQFYVHRSERSLKAVRGFRETILNNTGWKVERSQKVTRSAWI